MVLIMLFVVVARTVGLRVGFSVLVSRLLLLGPTGTLAPTYHLNIN